MVLLPELGARVAGACCRSGRATGGRGFLGWGSISQARCCATHAHSLFRASPGALPAFQGSEACSRGLIAHLSQSGLTRCRVIFPQPCECRADCCLAGREPGEGGRLTGSQAQLREAMPTAAAAPGPAGLAGLVSEAAEHWPTRLAGLKGCFGELCVPVVQDPHVPKRALGGCHLSLCPPWQ